MNWTIPVYVPYLDRVVKYYPYTNRNQEHIIKYCGSEDKIGLLQYFKQMLKELCVTGDIDPENLPVIDQVMMLLRLRSMCSGHELKLVIPDPPDEDDSKKDGTNNPPVNEDDPPPITRNDDDQIDDSPKGITYNVSLINIQRSIHENYQSPITVGDPTHVEITLHYPTRWSTVETVDYIKCITVNNTTIEHGVDNKQQILKLLDNIPIDLVTSINKVQKLLEKSIQSMVFIETLDNDNIYFDHDYYIDMLMTIYGEEYPHFIEMMYVFVKMIHMPLSDVMSLTPVDTQMYYKAFEKENEEREKSRKRSN